MPRGPTKGHRYVREYEEWRHNLQLLETLGPELKVLMADQARVIRDMLEYTVGLDTLALLGMMMVMAGM